MKKLSALLLAILLLASLLQGVAEEGTPAEQVTLRVGSTTPMRGEFFTELWGNATSDIDVRRLLHGYNLVRWDGSISGFAFDRTVIRDVKMEKTENGDHTYTIRLQQDLQYSDETAITARDYAFSLLLQMSPVIAEIGGVPMRRDYLVGGAAYLEGQADVLAGVRVLADDTLAVTVSHEYLPFFYEIGLLQCNPYPIHVIAPGVAVADDGEGVYLANEDPDVSEPVFTAELLKKTILDPETGYQSHPAAVSGPYQLTGWDGQTAEFTLNPCFKGNASGKKPTIQNLVYTLAENDTMLEKLRSGEFGLLNKVMRADVVREALEMAKSDEFTASKYPRTGLSFISFSCEKPAVNSEKVRQAIAWCLDRDAIVANYTDNNGIRVDGYYGVGQWMYGIVTGSIQPPVDPPAAGSPEEEIKAYEKTMAAYKALNLRGLTKYAVDTNRAVSLLEADGWTLNDQGIREKEINGETVTLDLVLAYPEGNSIEGLFQSCLVPNLEKAGIRLTLKPMSMEDLLTAFYKQGDREADMLYLASNFDLLFDPSVNFILSEDGVPNWSYTNHEDQTLYRLAQDMRATRPGDVLTYLKKWVAFQERFNKTLPMIPIYSNMYFDVFTSDLVGYQAARYPSWSEAIVPATLK